MPGVIIIIIIFSSKYLQLKHIEDLRDYFAQPIMPYIGQRQVITYYKRFWPTGVHKYVMCGCVSPPPPLPDKLAPMARRTPPLDFIISPLFMDLCCQKAN